MIKATTAAQKGRPRSFDINNALKQALHAFWQHGYTGTSMSLLCRELRLCAPSLYAAFGSKAEIFCKAVDAYEKEYWEPLRATMLQEPDIFAALELFFTKAAEILTLPDEPCGCMVVLAISADEPSEEQVKAKVRTVRLKMAACFKDKLQGSAELSQNFTPAQIDAFANYLNTLLEGMTMQAQLGQPREVLQQVGLQAAHMFKSYVLSKC